MVLEKLKLVPHEPGCYLMKNSDGVIIYFIKPKRIRTRIIRNRIFNIRNKFN